jgi:pilus assembly protein Flp/PilA
MRARNQELQSIAWRVVCAEFLIFAEPPMSGSAVEYGLLAALIAVVIITAVTTLGTNLKSIFNSVATSI